VLRNNNGFALDPGVSPGVLGANGHGFSFALWFRLDDYQKSNPTHNVVMQLVLSAPSGGGRNVTLSLMVSYNATNSPVMALKALFCCGSVLSDADYAVSSSDLEFQPRPNNNTFAVGAWQHVVVAFDAAGLQSGLFWNGVEQDAVPVVPGSQPVDLGALLGSPPPYGPVISGSLGYDLTGNPEFTPLWGAIGDLQVYADLQADAGMAAGLFVGSTASCAGTPPPPLPPAPPGGYSPPPPSPPSPPFPPPQARNRHARKWQRTALRSACRA